MAMKLTKEQIALIEKQEGPAREKVMEVKNLVINFKTDNGMVQAVRGVSFDLYKGETLCIVGESGSGKSVTSKAIMGILSKNAVVPQGQIIYEGEDLIKVSEEEFQRIRGKKIGMIFQDPLSSLNPIVRIGKQIIETMMVNHDQLKLHYNDLIADKLIPLKNAKVERDHTIGIAKGQVEELSRKQKKQEDTFAAEHPEDKAGLSALKKEHKAALAEAKAECKRKTDEAKAAYKEVYPDLKKALDVRKKEAKVENAEYAEGLKAKRDEALAEIDAQIAAFKADQERWAKIEAFDKEIKKISLKYKVLEILVYFFMKVKMRILMKRDQELSAVQAKRSEVAAQYDEFVAKRTSILEEYQSSVNMTKKIARKKAIEVMREVGIPQPEKRFRQYPFQFSGGMRQRIVIAIALIAEPDVLICDEPTTALDVTIQAQILDLINRLKAAHQMSVIFITHDLGVVANMADRVAVMYAGKICEYGTDKEVFFDPRHPYTWALLSSIPDIDSKEKLEAIPGTPPDMIYPPEGDAFAARNKYALAVDFKYEPPYFKITDSHYAATWLEYEDAPEVEMPKIVTQRILGALEEERRKLSDEK